MRHLLPSVTLSRLALIWARTVFACGNPGSDKGPFLLLINYQVVTVHLLFRRYLLAPSSLFRHTLPPCPRGKDRLRCRSAAAERPLTLVWPGGQTTLSEA